MCCSVLCHLGLFFLLVSEPAPLYSCSIERNEKIIFRHTPKRRNKMFISTEKYILIICIYLFLKQIFTEHLLCTWHNSRSWTYSSEWERKYFTFLKLISFVGRKRDVNTHTCICTCKCTQIYMTLWHITNCKFSVYNSINFNICVHLWNHDCNQDSEYIHHRYNFAPTPL